MQDSDYSTVALVIQSLPAVALSLFGGFVSLFTKEKNKEFSIRLFLGGLLAAAFVGLILNIGMLEFGASEGTRAVTVSLGGYCARDVLTIISKKFLSTVKVKIDEQ